MHVLLVNMPTPPKLSFGRRSQPLGIAYLAAYMLGEGHSVDVYEANAEGGSVDTVVERCLQSGADVIGFSATTPSFPLVSEATARYRASGGAATLVAGGHHVSAVLPTSALLEAPALDCVASGEGEQTLAEVVARRAAGADLAGVKGLTWRRGEELIANPRRALLPSLDALPTPARDLLPALSEYAGVRRWPTLDVVPCATIAASRGCPYRCSFCDIQSFYRREDGPMRRVRRPEQVTAEMAMVRDRYGAQHFAFVDDLFPYGPNWVARFSAGLADAGNPGTFSFAARADQIVRNPELLTMLAQAGCSSIEMGIESGSQSVLDRYQKDLTVAVNADAVKLVRAAGIRTIIDYIMFDPWSTLQELDESLTFLENVGADTGYPTTAYTRLSFYPGTPLYERWTAESRPEHDDPEWFTDPEVAQVWAALGTFRAAAQRRINEEIEAWRVVHRQAIASGDDPVRRQAVTSMYRIRRLPHLALRQLVALALGSRLPTESDTAVRRTLATLDDSSAHRADLSLRELDVDLSADSDLLLSATE
jgi:radical SAM superfamily enzyme YgiQ (UPF0313 family)